MLLLDANLLIYAYDRKSPFHKSTRHWLDRALETEPVIGLPWISVLAFVRITTHLGSPVPQTIEQAAAIIDDLLAQPNVQTVGPGERHWEVLKRTATAGQARGALFMDAVLAALAIEYGATLYTADRGFARFPGLRFVNPIAAK